MAYYARSRQGSQTILWFHMFEGGDVDMALCSKLVRSLSATVPKANSLKSSISPVYRFHGFSSTGSAGSAGCKSLLSFRLNGRTIGEKSNAIAVPIAGLMNCRYFAVSPPNVKSASMSRMLPSQAYIASVSPDSFWRPICRNHSF